MVVKLFLWVIIILTTVTGLLILLHHAQVGVLKNKKYKKIFYTLFSIEVVIIILSLFGGPLLNKIYAYRDNVLSQSEEECKQDDAPFWCNF